MDTKSNKELQAAPIYVFSPGTKVARLYLTNVIKKGIVVEESTYVGVELLYIGMEGGIISLQTTGKVVEQILLESKFYTNNWVHVRGLAVDRTSVSYLPDQVLDIMLETAVELEEYEKAAELRDEINCRK